MIVYTELAKHWQHPFTNGLPRSLWAVGQQSGSPAAHYYRAPVRAGPQLLWGVPCHLCHTESLSLLAEISTLPLKPGDQKNMLTVKKEWYFQAINKQTKKPPFLDSVQLWSKNTIQLQATKKLFDSAFFILENVAKMYLC